MTNTTCSLSWLKSGGVGPLLLLAHGAGAPMDSEFMERLAWAMAEEGVQVWRFEFNYMAARRQGAPRRPPPNARALLEEWRGAIREAAGKDGVFIGGKSLGGRVASMLAARPEEEDNRLPLKGCLCFGYPFHPPGKPDRWRTDHFPAVSVPTFVAQGERDPFGKRERVSEHMAGLPDGAPRVAIEWVTEGNHDLVPPKRSPATWESNLRFTARRAAAFMLKHSYS